MHCIACIEPIAGVTAMPDVHECFQRRAAQVGTSPNALKILKDA
jgi:hypothetical protein